MSTPFTPNFSNSSERSFTSSSKKSNSRQTKDPSTKMMTRSDEENPEFVTLRDCYLERGSDESDQ